MLKYTSFGRLKRLATSKYGGIAQLGERLNGIQEVSGSIPLISTMRDTKQKSVSVWKRIFVLCFSRAFWTLKEERHGNMAAHDTFAVSCPSDNYIFTYWNVDGCSQRGGISLWRKYSR